MILRVFCVIAFFLVVRFSYAQEEYEQYYPTQSDEEYREERMRRTIPPYGLDKVQKLVKTIESKSFDEGDAGIGALTATQYKALSLREKFTYVMINPEMYSQNCAIFVPLPNEDKKIFGQLMSWVDESTWSDRQLNFLRENRDSVQSIIQESTRRSRKMGVNYKDAILVMNAWEMIPFLITYYKSNPRDKDALTVLLLLMKAGEFVDFLKSSSYRALYTSDYNYEKYINFNSANEKLIIERAMAYYNEKIKTN